MTFYWDIITAVGLIVVTIFLLISVLSMISLVLLYFFHRKGKMIFPYFILSVVSTLEVPIERLIRFFQIEGINVDLIITQLRNKLNRKAFSKVPVSERTIFFPQCLRNFKCPARTGEEGIYCMNCGLCGIGKL